MGLTPRQAEILAYITEYSDIQGYAPTLQEIGEKFGLSSVATVHKHISNLVEKGYLRRERRNASRDIDVVEQGGGPRGLARIPLLGTVAAGLPIEALDDQEEINLPEEWLGKGRTFALRVRGDSMIDLGIFHGDFVVARQQNTANKGDVIIAGIPGDEATIKTFISGGEQVVLEPANATLSTMTFMADEITIFGKVVTVMRKL